MEQAETSLHAGCAPSPFLSPRRSIREREVAGRRITSVLGLVRGNSVRARNLVRDIQALGRTVVGGRIDVYAELLEESREEALAKMPAEARALGADGVVATRLGTSQVMSGAAKVLAYGTAVRLE